MKSSSEYNRPRGQLLPSELQAVFSTAERIGCSVAFLRGTMLRDDDDLSWYARKAARALAQSGSGGDTALEKRISTLLTQLRAHGVKGDPRSMTFYTRRLPPGCRLCLRGCGTNLYVTGLCTRDCFFCFNQKPRKDEIVAHGIPVKTPEAAAEIVERFDLRSIGISGGEPLLFPDRVLAIIAALRGLKRPLRIDLYSNGDRAEEPLLRRLRDAGLDAIRFNLASRDYDTTPVRTALRVFREVAVEIPVIPAEIAHQKRMIIELDIIGVPFLNLHELFVCSENHKRMEGEGHSATDKGHKHLLWQPVASSGIAALELLLFAARRTRVLSAYYCSCGTQELISRRGLSRRKSISEFQTS